jgi:hypothetical protein
MAILGLEQVSPVSESPRDPCRSRRNWIAVELQRLVADR